MDSIKRETFWMIPVELRVALYVAAVLSLMILLWGTYRRYKAWQKSRFRKSIDWDEIRQNLASFLDLTVRQRKVRKDLILGYLHQFVSYGFVILILGTVLVLIDFDLGIPVLQGNFYLGFELIMDLFGVLVVAGLIMAVIIRVARGRKRLKNGLADHAFLLLLLVICVSGFVLEGVRLAETQTIHGQWSPVGYTLGSVFQGMGLFDSATYPLWWSGHAALAMILIGLIPYTRFFHFFTAAVNTLIQPVKRTGDFSTPYHLDEPGLSKGNLQGVVRVADFTNLQLLSTDACTECGRCEEQCPAFLSEKPLSPRISVLKIRKNMTHDLEITSFLTPEELYSCTTCGACVEACPVSINHIDLILSMRRGLLSQGLIETQAEKVLARTEEQLNIWGKPWSERGGWCVGRDIPVLATKTD